MSATGHKRDIAAEIIAAAAAWPDTTKRPPGITLGSRWNAPIWGINTVTDIRVSWCGDTEVLLSKAGWWEAVALRETFDSYSAQPCAYSNKERASK